MRQGIPSGTNSKEFGFSAPLYLDPANTAVANVDNYVIWQVATSIVGVVAPL
jgi:hypothetical protein